MRLFFCCCVLSGTSNNDMGESHALLWIVVDQIRSESEPLYEVFPVEDINYHNG